METKQRIRKDDFTDSRKELFMRPSLKKVAIFALCLTLAYAPLTTSFAETRLDVMKPIIIPIQTTVPFMPTIPIMPIIPIIPPFTPSPGTTEAPGTWPSVYEQHAPTHLTITPVWGTDQATLTWDDTNASETGYILQKIYQDGPSITVHQTVAEYAANTTSATISVPKCQITQYGMIAVNAAQGKSSSLSNLVSIEGLPMSPTNLVVTLDPSGAAAISLKWTNPVQNANLSVKWIIERTAPGTWPGIIKPENPDFLDVNVKPDTLYTYVLKAVSGSGESNPVVCSFLFLSPPQALEVAAWPGSTAVSVTWKDNRTIVDHFELVYKQKDYDDSTAKTLNFPPTTQNTQIIVSNGTSYTFKIRSVMKEGNPSPYSPVAVFMPTGGEVAPVLPTGVTLATVDNHIAISFKETSQNVQQYLVERISSDGGEPFVFGTIPNGGNASVSGAVTLSDSTLLNAGTTYTYRIKAQNTYGESAFTAPVSTVYMSMTPPAPPLPPLSPVKMIALILGSSKMNVDGTTLDIDPGKDTQPLISAKGRTLIPIRSIIEKLGGTLEWFGSENKVVIRLNDKVMELIIGQARTLVNGNPVISDEAPQIVNGRTMLPLRFVGENLGLKVAWNATTKTITVQP